MFGVYQRLMVPVWASDRTVIKACKRILTDEAYKKENAKNRKRLYRALLVYHHDAQKLCADHQL